MSSDTTTDDGAAAKPSGMVVEREGAVAVVRLERSAKRNTIDLDTCRELTELLEGATTDKSIRAIVVTGSGRDFCTGAEVARPGGGDAAGAMSALDYRWGPEAFRRLFQALWEVEKPVVSAVNGTVAGAGWMLALLADLVVASTDARWTHVFARRGMVPHAGDPYFLPRIIPFHRLNEIALLSDPISSATMESWGLVNRLVAADEVLPTALDLGRRLAEGPTRALGLTRKLYRSSLSVDMLTSFDQERAATALLSTTADRKEGMLSLMEGRPPKFIGD